MPTAPGAVLRLGPCFPVFVILYAALSFGAPYAQAAADPAELENLVRQGNELREKGRDHPALPFFQRAYDLSPSPRTAALLGLVELALGYSIQAEGHLSEALLSPHHLWVAKNREQLNTALAGARRAIGRVEVRGSPDGAAVVVNANAVGTLPLGEPIKVSEGSVQVLVKAAGFEEKMVRVNVAGGSTEKVAVNLSRLDVSQAAKPRDPRRRQVLDLAARSSHPALAPGWVRPAAWATGGLAAGAFGLAIYGFIRADQSSNAFNGEKKPGTQEHACDAGIPMQGPAPCATWAREQSSAQRLGYVGLTAGIVLGAAATVGFLWSASDLEHLALSSSNEGISASWRGRF
jgi:hypothetical protein